MQRHDTTIIDSGYWCRMLRIHNTICVALLNKLLLFTEAFSSFTYEKLSEYKIIYQRKTNKNLEKKSFNGHCFVHFVQIYEYK